MHNSTVINHYPNKRFVGVNQSTSSSVNKNPAYKSAEHTIDLDANDYYAIAITGLHDVNTNGVYVINRGTYTKQNMVSSDLDMALAQSPNIFTAGIYYVEFLLNSNSNIQHIGFAGHSLGGSIAQAQVVYFYGQPKRYYTLSNTKNFEPFGIGNIIANLDQLNQRAEMIKHPTPMSPAQFDALALSAGTVATSQTPVNQALRERYKPNTYQAHITNYCRLGDGVAGTAEIIGHVIPIATDYTMGESVRSGIENSSMPATYLYNSAKQVGTDMFYNLHVITNYRYQAYAMDGKLIPTLVSQSNNNEKSTVDILVKTGNKDLKARYNLVFKAMKNYKAI